MILRHVYTCPQSFAHDCGLPAFALQNSGLGSDTGLALRHQRKWECGANAEAHP